VAAAREKLEAASRQRALLEEGRALVDELRG
jgi:hypothetical protein